MILGPNACNLATALESIQIPYSVVEMNVRTLRKLHAKGIRCVYGDAPRPEVLEEAGIRNAGILAITFPDIRTGEAAVQLAKTMNPKSTVWFAPVTGWMLTACIALARIM